MPLLPFLAMKKNTMIPEVRTLLTTDSAFEHGIHPFSIMQDPYLKQINKVSGTRRRTSNQLERKPHPH